MPDNTMSFRFANAHRVLGRTRVPRPSLAPETRKLLTQSHKEKKRSEDAEVAELIHHIQTKVIELSSRFQRTPRRYYEKIYIGSHLRQRRHKKTSRWAAFMHFKSKEANEGNNDKGLGKKSNLGKLAHSAKDYHSMDADVLDKMVEELTGSHISCPRPPLPLHILNLPLPVHNIPPPPTNPSEQGPATPTDIQRPSPVASNSEQVTAPPRSTADAPVSPAAPSAASRLVSSSPATTTESPSSDAAPAPAPSVATTSTISEKRIYHSKEDLRPKKGKNKLK
ncbi:hypothetical protein BJ138DRAFT_1120529 [Hygrophoropsis aurantiaca]|uniref:Uncharacterized protein n=1 Tax=Hygrophoropsis aurantiaca TaxID=72124 RepID=A0ACB7ZQ58_9AGAM|nr:hypothetical protein BJ138DRAFT_1120529 [Hygrophoropsis aurantiaca]